MRYALASQRRLPDSELAPVGGPTLQCPLRQTELTGLQSGFKNCLSFGPMVIMLGLLSSTALNMVVVPILYERFGRPAAA